MIAFQSQLRVFLYRTPTDMRKSFHGLVALTESALKQDPLSGSLFVFVNKRRDRIKVLYWGQTGFCIWYQQLQQGTYQLPDAEAIEQQQTIDNLAADNALLKRSIFGSRRERFTDPAQTFLMELGGPGRTLKGYLWVGVGDAHHPYDCFFYTSDRRSIRPESMLEGFQGYLTADAYVAYERIGRLWPDVI